MTTILLWPDDRPCQDAEGHPRFCRGEFMLVMRDPWNLCFRPRQSRDYYSCIGAPDGTLYIP